MQSFSDYLNPRATLQKPQQEQKSEQQSSVFSFFDALIPSRNKSSTQQQSSPSNRGGQRNNSMVSSSYDVYGKKLFEKEGGLRYDLFTGERKPSQPLDKMTIGQIKKLQQGREDSAAGAYQFTLATLEDTQKDAGLSDNDVFDAKNQYKLFETFTRKNEEYARNKLGVNSLNDAQRYAMHFLGRYGGVKFLSTLKENPSANFAEMFPKAFARNPDFISRAGGKRATLQDVFGLLSNKMK